MRKKARDLRPGDIISVREIINPRDPMEVAHEWSDIVVIEPMQDTYRVHTGTDILVLEGDTEVEVRDAT